METLLIKLTISNLTRVKPLNKIIEGVMINKCLFRADCPKSIKKIAN